MKYNLKNLTRNELVDLLAGIGKEQYRADQIIRWLYLHRVTSLEEMSNLSRVCRRQLQQLVYLPALVCVAREMAADGTEKFLYRLADGCCVESVLIPDKNRLTLCVSTQVGCRQGCRFCVTGQQGFTRNLATAEIVDQVVQTQKYLDSQGKNIRNLVFMGMGEPLDNFAAVVKAVEIIQYNDGLQFSSRRITLSTCGLVPEMAALGKQTEICLAVSLNATMEAQRSELMPVNRRYPLAELLLACRHYPLKRRRRITFEYILLHGFNDSRADARRLVRMLAPLKAKINLIPFNEHPLLSFKRPSETAIAVFRDILLASGLTVMVRKSKGADIQAACGQLRGRMEPERSRGGGDSTGCLQSWQTGNQTKVGQERDGSATVLPVRPKNFN